MFKGLKALITGIAAGTALGVLFSPKKGEDIRKNFKKEVNDGGTGFSTAKDTLKGLGKDLKDTCEDCWEEIEKSDEYKKGKTKLKKAYKKNVSASHRRKIKDSVKKAKKSASDAVNKMKKK